MIVQARWWVPESEIYLYKVDDYLIQFTYYTDPQWRNGSEVSLQNIIEAKPFKATNYENTPLPHGARKSHIGRNHHVKTVRKHQYDRLI